MGGAPFLCFSFIFDTDLFGWDVRKAERWFYFAKNSLLEKYPGRIYEKFRKDCL
jgi:hypothetical protein